MTEMGLQRERFSSTSRGLTGTVLSAGETEKKEVSTANQLPALRAVIGMQKFLMHYGECWMMVSPQCFGVIGEFGKAKGSCH